ncbi:DnrO protein [Thermomonas sp.]
MTATSVSEHGADEHRVDVHDAHSTRVSGLPAPPATPWPSDAPLREGMRRMHHAVVALGHAEHGHLDVTQTVAATEQVQQAANFMIANCKLAPEPDAALHGLLVGLLNGATKIKADPNDTTPVAGMREAIALYPRMFEDAGWQADTARQE